nr:MAG TPA: hypothetical protein [Caudoviricetes sp.]
MKIVNVLMFYVLFHNYHFLFLLLEDFNTRLISLMTHIVTCY